MFTASAKRKENIAEYLLYMWHVEDLIRAYGLDIDRISSELIDRFDLDDEQRRQMREWYESLIDMMRREDVAEKGHLQINRNTLGSIADLHRRLLADPKFEDYRAEFYKTLPFIVELRSKAGEEPLGEIETCFTALYGMLMMRLGRKEVSAETASALAQISKLMALLAHYYKLDDEDQLFKDEQA